MNKSFTEKLLKYIRAYRMRRHWINAVSFMAACVVFVVTYMLILPAITIESQKADKAIDDSALSDSAVIIENTNQSTRDSFAPSGGKITGADSISSESVAISDTPVNDITNVNNDEIPSGSAIAVYDNIASDGALYISLAEMSSEKEVEALTEATTISSFNTVALAYQGAVIAEYDDTANNARYAVSSTASGSYKITAEPINSGAYSIASDVFEHLQNIDKTQIEGLELADGIVSIGSGAFMGCKGLTYVDIAPNSTLTTIESAAFSGCSRLSSINLEACSALQSIGCKGIDDITSQAAESSGAFYGSALTSVALPSSSSVTEIGSYAFAGCSRLESVDFGGNSNNVSFGAYIFKNDAALKSVNIEALSGSAKFYTIQTAINEAEENVNAMFSGCSSLKALKLSNVSADSNLSYLCYGCSSLESLDLSGAADLSLTYSSNSPGFEENVICYELNNIVTGCDSLKTLDLSVFTNMTMLAENIIEGGVETVILPYNIETLTPYSCSSSNLLNVEFEKDENGKSHLKSVLNYTFSNNTGIREITLDFSYADKGTAQLCAAVFRGCTNLEKVTVISDDAMNYFGIWDTDTMPSNIKELVYNVHSATGYTGIEFTNNESFKLTLGDNVSILDINLIAAIRGHITSYSFAPDHAFKVDGAGDFPFDEAALYYADAGGNLYRQSGAEAELVYANRDGAGECTVPEQVGFSYNGTAYNLNVTAIGKDAFKGTGYESILFESPDNITALENRAFADAFQLSRIGRTTADGGEYYNNEADIKGMFANARGKMGTDLFANTAILSVPFDSGVEESSDGSIYYVKADGKPIETFYINRITTSSVSWLDGQQGCLATGETGFFEINTSYNAGDNHMFRMYVKTYDECVLSYGTYFNSEGVETKTEPVDCGDGVYYYYIPSGRNYDISIGFTYPNNTAPNKSVYVWSVRGESESDLTALGNAPIYPTPSGVVEGFANVVTSSKYLKYTWKTKADTFAVSKEPNANITPAFVKSGSEICVGGASFSIKLNNTTQHSDVRTGNDHVKYVRYEDTMTLPEGFSWRGNPAEWSNVRCEIAPGGLTGIIYVSVDGKEYTVCEVELYNERLISLSLKTKLQTIKDSEGNTRESTVPVICWTLENVDKTTEIPNPTEAILIFGSELIIAQNMGQDAHYNEITNDVTAYVDYCFSPEAEPITASAVLSVSKEKGGLSLKKETLTAPSFDETHNLLGEDIKYRITLKNETAFSYTGAVKITDNLFKDSAAENRRILYIRPENMQQMFDDKYGDKLTITINDAILYNNLPDNAFVTAVDGSTSIRLSAANTSAEVFGDDKYDALGAGAYEYYNGRYDTADVGISCEGTITITKQATDSGSDLISINYPVKNEDGTVNYNNSIKVPDSKGTIKDALESIGYAVTKYDSYTLTWDYGENETVESEEERIYSFVASVKNTFQYLSYTDKGGEDKHNGGDHYRYYNEPNWYGEIIIDNTATLIENVGEDTTEVIASADVSPKVLRDLVVEKHAYRDGVLIPNQAFATSFSIKDENTVITYNVEATHFGSGVYDVLPVVDHITGIQVLLAPVGLNQGREWATSNNLDTFTYNGTHYYVLNKDGIYNGVQLDNRYADKVIVKTDNINGRDTIIKWYCADVSYDTVIDFTYEAIVSQQYAGVPSIGAEYTLSSESWLNDHPSHRIWDPILGGGTTILFDKNILSPVTDSETGETVYEPVKKSSISMNYNTVRYRLEIGSSGGNGRSVTGADIYDMLPVTGDTAGVFAWRKETDGQGNPANVSIDYEVTDPAKVQILYGEGDNRIDLTSADYTGFDEYTLQYDCPATDNAAENDSFQQYIKWDDSFEIHFGDNSSNCTAYIYVTLTFPDTLNEWSDYIAACGSKTLSNTLYLFNMHAEVTHSLASPGEALFQKGVYETGYYICDSWSGNYTTAYYRENDRFHYSRTVGDGNDKYFNNNKSYFETGTNGPNTIDSGNAVNTVTYYVIIKNEGVTPLSLSTIYDVLPEGFGFMAFTPLTYVPTGESGYPAVGELNLLTNPPNSMRNKCYLYNWCDSPLAKTDSYKRPSTTNDDGEIIYPYVKYEGTDSITVGGASRNRLRFKIYEDSTCTTELDSLKEGEEIQFGYTCYTGSSPDTAENICAMEFIDNAGVGVTQVGSDSVIVSDTNKLPANDGDRQVIEGYNNAEMLGFTEKDPKNPTGDEHKKWLASSVDVQIGEVTPQIEETLISTGPFDYNSVPQWEILSQNNGKSSMAGYTISDTMQYPYKFQGSVSYSIFAGDGSSIYRYTPDTPAEIARLENPLLIQTAKDGYLFTIGERIEDSSAVKITTNNGEEVDLEIGKPTTINVVMTNIHNREFVIPLNITISENADKSEALSLTSGDAAWVIPAGGSSVMTLQTAQAPRILENGAYDNVATLTTANDGTTVTSISSVAISNTSSTSSSKEVTELIYDKVSGEYAESENAANSETAGDKHICLSNKSNRFRYTLTIQNTGSANAMSKLIITDNLPFIGDRTPAGREAERDSGFMVKFAGNPNISVMSAKLDAASGNLGEMQPKSCTVEYSDKYADFNDTDLNGVSSKNWYGDKRDTSRSVRFIIENVDKGECVKITFDAVADENAAAGTTAWSSFAYKYTDSADTSAKWMLAAPDKVGVQVPSAPNIVKALENSIGDTVTADKDYSFDFILYEGETKSFTGYSEAEICSELAGSAFTKFTLSVAAGNSQSDNIIIESGEYPIYEYDSADSSLKSTSDMFTFADGRQYNVVEINPSEDNYKFDSLNAKQHSFSYDITQNEEISVINTRKDWQISITKMNEAQTEYLEGAVFGLYRKYAEGADNTSKLSLGQLNALKDKGAGIKDIVIDGEGTFYLYDVFPETDANGLTTISNLTDEVYVVKELIAPIGYISYNDSSIFKYNAEGAAATVTNVAFGPPLPATGSNDMLIAVTVGLAFISIVIAFIIRRLLISKFE